MSLDSEALKIVEAALGVNDPAARASYIASVCGDRAELLARVEHLLSYEALERSILPTESFLQPLGVIEHIPEQIGPFAVTREIARGGMGAVVLARRNDGRFEQEVAIKLIRTDLASQRARERFATERRILGRLQHPAIVRILDGGEIEGRPWLAMEYVDGLPIDRGLDAIAAPQRFRLTTFARVCEAVAHAHRQMVVHADIKPSNVLIDTRGGVHLLDFGIAKLVSEIDVDETGDPYPLTRSYAAPERGVGLVPTVASDVYSLGVLLLVMLGLPVPAEDSPFEPGTRLPAGLLSGDLAAIAARALAEDPVARYPDAATLGQDVVRHLSDLPVQVREHEGWRYLAGRFMRRHRRGLALTSLAGCILLTTAIGATWQYWRAEQARAEAEVRFADAQAVASYLLFDHIPSLDQTPHSLRQRVAAAEVAELYLARLANSAQASDAIRLEAAKGLLQLATLQGRSGRPNLGLPEPARANLARAAEIAAGLKGGAAETLLANIHIEQVRLETWFQADLAEAERFAGLAQQSAAIALEHDPRIGFELALVLAGLAGFQGRFAEQERLAREALAILPDNAGRDAGLDRALLTSSLGEATYYLGRPQAALRLYRDSLSTISTMHAQTGLDPYLLDRLAKAHWEVGTTLLELRRYPEANTHLQQAVERASELAAFDPANSDARRMLLSMRAAQAQGLGLSGRFDAALAMLQTNLAEQRARSAAEQTPLAARDLAYAHLLIGETLTVAGRQDAACRADRIAMRQYSQLERQGWLSRFDEVGNIALLEQRMATNCS